jgi:selT/selW/selH-like putative selenoprotein
LEEAFENKILVREIRDPGVTGNFEVVLNGENVWSKTNGQGFPSTQEKVETIIAAIKSKETASIKKAIAGPDIHIQYCGG